MMPIYKLILLLGVVCWATVIIATPAADLTSANQLATDGKYSEAIQLYENIHAAGYRSENLYYNWGNAHFHSQNYPAAILAYERALLINPNDADTQLNLSIANAHITDQVEPIPTFFLVRIWNTCINLLPSRTWAVLTLLLLWVATTTLILRMLYPQRIPYRWAPALTTIMFILASLSLLFGYLRYQGEFKSNAAIVFAKEIPLKAQANTDAETLVTLHEGVKVAIEHTEGGWFRIRLANGEEGWIPSDALQLI
jgi:tetratricopeptide (TPR) repeat protein